MKNMLALGFAISASTAMANDPDGRDRRVVVVNETSDRVLSIYGSNVNRTEWEDDILGNDVIDSNSRRRIGFYDGTNNCMYDLRIKMSNEQEYVHRGVNVCRLTRWRIHDGHDHLDYPE